MILLKSESHELSVVWPDSLPLCHTHLDGTNLFLSSLFFQKQLSLKMASNRVQHKSVLQQESRQLSLNHIHSQPFNTPLSTIFSLNLLIPYLTILTAHSTSPLDAGW